MAILKVPVTAEDHIQGSEEAPLTLVEYGDYQCPYCGEAYPLVKRVQEQFGERLRFVFRNFPLREAHPFAEVAAETAEFAAAHELFWEMHDLLYEYQANLALPTLFQLAESIGLDSKKLETALERKIYVPKIQQDFMGGVKSGVNGTPTFFINGQRYNGPAEFDAMVAELSTM